MIQQYIELCVISIHVCVTPYRQAMILGGQVYFVKAREQRTEHFGTPNNNNSTSDKTTLIDNLFDYYSNYVKIIYFIYLEESTLWLTVCNEVQVIPF